MKSLFVILLIFSNSLLAGTPTDVLQAFQKGAKEQKFEAVWKHTAQFEGASPQIIQYLRSRTQRIINLSADGWDFEILEEKIKGDCAVLLVNEYKNDKQTSLNIDPVFMIKQGHEWRVFPGLTNWDLTQTIPLQHQPQSMKLDEAQIAAFKEFEIWVDKRTNALQKQKREQGKP